jgi:hypothetical protein
MTQDISWENPLEGKKTQPPKASIYHVLFNNNNYIASQISMNTIEE